MTGSPRILVVDDEPVILNLMVEALTARGYGVIPARGGQEAVEIFSAERPDLVITDVFMPGMNGLEVTEAIKAVSPETEVLILTGHSSVATAIDSLRLGASDYLLKPLELTELERSVKRALERSRRVREDRTLVRRLEGQLQVRTEELSVSQRRSLAVFNAISDSLVIINRAFTIVEANEGAAGLSGVPARELVGRTCYRELFAREDVCPGCPALRTFAGGEPASVSMCREDPGGGRGPRDLEVTTYPLGSEAEVIHEAVECVRDVTALKGAEEERLALRAERDRNELVFTIGRLAAGVAHDFNTQLTIIKGCVQFLLDAMPLSDPCRGDAERISATADRGARLVRRLLALSSPQKLQRRSLDLGELIRGMAPVLRPFLGEGALLRVRMAPGLWRVSADPAQIEQVVMNLVVNARDAMAAVGTPHPAGTLTLEMANVDLDEGSLRPALWAVVPGSYVMLAVSDTGSGMAPEVRRQIFEPFFTTKPPGQGVGLGLSTVLGIVKEHRGYVVCESDPGHGATFRVFLPRDASEQEASAEEWPLPPTCAGTPVTALVVDDDPEVCEVLRRGLEKTGHRVYTAGGVEEALAVAARIGDPIHLLVTDAVLPGGTGKALAERLQATFPALRVLFISGYLHDPVPSPELPGAFFLQKPFGPDDLARRVREVLESGI